ncbi:MAG: hypothetical protein GX029_09960 [Pseudomonadaceae bacterium]|nr:hypothetical protein [Pseudomonadaceae bacterium]
MNQRLNLADHALSLLGLTVAVALLYLFSSVTFNNLTFTALTLTFAWFIYGYLDGKRRMWRHALLSHITTKNSKLRQFFWESFVSKLLHATFALISGLVILIIINRLQTEEWLLLLLSLFTFYGLFIFFERQLANELVATYRIFTSLSLAYWLNLILLLAVSSIYHLYFVEFADTRSQPLVEVITTAYNQGLAQSNSELMGLLLGLDKAWQAASLHLMQFATTEAPVSPSYKIAAWVIFFIYMALQYVFLWLILLGSLVFTLNIRQQGWDFFAEKGLYRPALMTLAGLSLVSLAGYQLSQTAVFNSAPFYASKQALQPKLETPPPCIPENFRQQLAGLEQLAANQTVILQAEFEREFNKHLAATRAQWLDEVDTGVDAFLDWNFSMAGQYSSLLHWVITVMPGDPLESAAVQLMINKSGIKPNQLYNSLDALIEQRIIEKVNFDTNKQITQLENQAETLLNTLFTTSNQRVEQLLQKGTLIDPSCLEGSFPTIDLTGYFKKNYSGLGSTAIALPFLFANTYRAHLTSRLARASTAKQANKRLLFLPVKELTARASSQASVRGAKTMIANRATKRLVSKTSTKIASRIGAGIASKAATSGAAGAAGGFCGPAALVCGPVLAISAFIGSELAINAIDEALNRAEMEEAMLQDFQRLVDQQLEEAKALVLDDLAEALLVQQTYQAKVFNAYRESLH